MEALAKSKMLFLLHPFLDSKSDGFAETILSLFFWTGGEPVTLQAVHTGPLVSPYKSPSS